MKFYYKTKDGYTGMVKDVDALPSNVDKLIIRRYDGRDIRIPYTNELILDCNRGGIEDILFKCDKLYVYRPNIEWFHVNHTWDGNDSQSSSTFNALIRLKVGLEEYAYGMFKNTLCNNIIPELDFTDRSLCYDVFRNTNINNIQHNIKIPTTMNYVGFYRGSKIPQHKLLASDRLVALGKKGEVS